MKTVIKGKKRGASVKKKAKREPKLYEAMFLVDSAEATTDWDGITGYIKSILEKAKAEIVAIRKWDDRRLAYAIKGKSKGTYILCYFKVEGNRLRDIEKDVQLSERIMRVLILCAEHKQAEDIEKESATQIAGEGESPKDDAIVQADETEASDSDSEQQEMEDLELPD